MNAHKLCSAAVRKFFSAFSIRRAIAKLLILALVSNQIFATPQMTAAYADSWRGWQQEARFLFYSQGWAGVLRALVQGKLDDKPTKPKEKDAEKQDDRDAQVAKLQMVPSGDISLATGTPITFNAAALSTEGAPISGVKLKWAVDDISADKIKRKGKPVITEHGVFYSPIAGDYLITVMGAKFQTSAKVTVTGDPQPPLNKLIEKYQPFAYGTLSTRDSAEVKSAATPQKIGALQAPRPATGLVAQANNPKTALRTAKETLRPAKTLHATPTMTAMATAAAFVQAGDPCGWNNSNWTTADDNGKERGDMLGHPADGGPGSGNYEFVAPVVKLDSRGLDMSLALTYNSRLWHKANSDITFDIDHDWPAPGWNMGFGRIVSMGTDRGFMIIDGDGTRHGYTGNALAPSGWQYFSGKTVDGTLIDYTVSAYNGIPSYGTVRLPNGTTIYYGAANNTTRAIYPTQITDAQDVVA